MKSSPPKNHHATLSCPEYDKYCETHKGELVDKEFHEEMTEAELDLQDLEMGEADEEVIKVNFEFFF